MKQNKINDENNISEMSKEKKKTIILTVILTVISIILVGLFVSEKLNTSSEAKEILKKYDEYFNSKERTVIYYAKENCTYCELHAPILEKIADAYKMDYFYLDSSKLSKSQKEKVLDELNIKNETPTTVIVEDGEVVDVKVGYTDGTEYVEFLKEAEILPEDAEYEDEKYISFIDYDKYVDLIKKNETSIIVIGQTTCSHCIAIKPALNAVARDYNITINYLNISKLDEDENRAFFDSLTELEYDEEEFKSEGSIGTPLTLIIKNGKITNYIEGEKTTSQLVKEFKKLNLISE